MNYWDLIGWALAVLVVAFVLLILVAALVGLVKPRPRFDRLAAMAAAEKEMPQAFDNAFGGRDGFVKGAEWQSKQRGRARGRG